MAPLPADAAKVIQVIEIREVRGDGREVACGKRSRQAGSIPIACSNARSESMKWTIARMKFFIVPTFKFLCFRT